MGIIVSLDHHRHQGEIEIAGTNWRIAADVPDGLAIGDAVEFLIESADLNWFDRRHRAVMVRRA